MGRGDHAEAAQPVRSPGANEARWKPSRDVGGRRSTGHLLRRAAHVGNAHGAVERRVGAASDLQRRLNATVCNDVSCVKKTLLIRMDSQARIIRMNKGSGVYKLLKKGDVQWQEELQTGFLLRIPPFAWTSDTIAFTCSSPRDCSYELLIDSSRLQSVAVRFNKTSVLPFSTDLSPPSTKSFPYQIVGYEGDRLPSVFWTVEGNYDSVSVAGLQGYRLNEEESRLEGVEVATETGSHFVSVSFQGEEQRAYVNTTVDVLRKRREAA